MGEGKSIDINMQHWISYLYYIIKNKLVYG